MPMLCLTDSSLLNVQVVIGFSQKFERQLASLEEAEAGLKRPKFRCAKNWKQLDACKQWRKASLWSVLLGWTNISGLKDEQRTALVLFLYI